MPLKSVKVFSFSGIDGAGKSTQIEALTHHFQQQGMRVSIYTFWDDIVVFSRIRERLSLSVFKGDRGVGCPDRPIVRRDKNVSSPPVMASRLLLYALDALRLCTFTYKIVLSDADVVIFDRYIYDELANLPLERLLVRLYVRFLLKLTRKPDFAFLLDGNPEAACARKPEYPLGFVSRNRESYLRLARLARMTVILPSTIEQTSSRIRELASIASDNQELGLSLSTDYPAPPDPTNRATT